MKFAKSTDSGGTWASGNIKTIETSAGWDMPSSITYDSGKIYLAYVATYLDEQNANYQRLTLATSTDTGATWTKSYPTQNPPNGYRSAISVGGNNMKILVENNLYSSTDGGSTWSDSNSSNNSKDSNNSNVSFGTGANFVVNGSSVVVSYYTTDNNGNNSLGIGNSTDSAGTFTLQTVGADADGWQTAIVNGNNKLFAFYKSMGGNQIYATSSSDSGVTWGTVSHTINLSHKAIGGSVPACGEGVVSMATDGTNVYAIDGDNGYIMKAALSSDGTWTTGRLPSNVGYWGAAMTATNQGVYIIAGGSGDTQVLRSTDHGTTFSSSSIEAGSSNVDGRQGIAVVGNNVYVCYPNIDFSTDAKTEYLKFAKSTDGGVTWSAGNIKTIATAPSWGSTCSITAYNGNLYIAFVLGDMNSSQLKFAKSTNDGSTWSTTLVDDRTGNGSLTLPAIAASADGVFIVDGALFYRSTTVGATWPSATEVSGDSNTYGGSNMSFVGSNMIVTYLDSNNHELFATLSTDHGGSWSQPVVVDADDAPGGFWARTGLAVSGSNVYVGYPSNKAQGVVKANKSTNGGASFSWP